MSNLADALEEYYDSQNWKYDYDKEEETFRMRINLKAVDSCSVFARVKNAETILIYSVFPIKAPEEKRRDIAEFITLANYNMILGNFELDFDDGEIRYKVSTLCGDIELAHEYVERQVDMGFYMLDRYGEGILSVLYGNVSPKDAIQKIEGSDEEDSNE